MQRAELGGAELPAIVPALASVPPFGVPTPVAPGIFWFQLPMAWPPGHINAWLLESADSWTIIDCGTDTAEVRKHWQAFLGGARIGGKPVTAIVGTHGHVDHIGLAGFLQNLTGAAFWCPITEFYSANWRSRLKPDGSHPDVAAFLKRHDCEWALAEHLRVDAMVRALIHPLPPSFKRIRHGDKVELGGCRWQVITAGGHAPEHSSLYCEEIGVLIAGDQVLPKITPFVGVSAWEPDADPLGEFLASFALFRPLPPDTLVLPGHGLPFRGLHTRLDQMDAHHARRLATTLEICAKPVTAGEVAKVLFPEAMRAVSRLAIAEAVAHLHYLWKRGQLRKTVDAGGVERFQV